MSSLNVQLYDRTMEGIAKDFCSGNSELDNCLKDYSKACSMFDGKTMSCCQMITGLFWDLVLYSL